MYACTHVCMLGIKYFLGPRSSPGTPGSWLPFRRPLAWRHNFWSSVLGNVSDWRQLLLNTLKAFKNCGKAWKSMMHDAHDFCLKLFDKISHCMFCMLYTWYGLTKMIPIPAKTISSQIGKMRSLAYHWALQAYCPAGPNESVFSLKLLQLGTTQGWHALSQGPFRFDCVVILYHSCLYVSWPHACGLAAVADSLWGWVPITMRKDHGRWAFASNHERS